MISRLFSQLEQTCTQLNKEYTNIQNHSRIEREREKRETDRELTSPQDNRRCSVAAVEEHIAAPERTQGRMAAAGSPAEGTPAAGTLAADSPLADKRPSHSPLEDTLQITRTNQQPSIQIKKPFNQRNQATISGETQSNSKT